LEKLYLGIDMGTTSAKCMAVDEAGAVLAIAQQGYPMRHPHQGWAEQDTEDYWCVLIEVVAGCVHHCTEMGHPADAIVSMAMSTQGDTLILTDEHGTALAPAMSWMDTRAEDEYLDLLRNHDQAFWYRETGSRLVLGSPACKIRWVARHQPELWSQVKRVCAVPDYLAARLSGRFVTDEPSASWSPCFTPQTRSWSPSVMQILGVSVEQLPQVAGSGAVIGPLLPDVAEKMGLTANTQLVAGAFDQAAAAHGARAAVGSRSALSCGTAWVLYTVAREHADDTDAMIPQCCHVNSSEWGLLMPFTGGAAYDWFHRTFRSGDCPSAGSREPLFFLPYLYGAGAPDWKAEARGTLIGLSMAHTPEDIELAVMRGIACETRRSVEVVESVCGQIPNLRMVGGATKSKSWPQIIANILNRPVEVSGCAESASYGAAMLAAGQQSASWQDIAQAQTVVPDPEATQAMQEYYARYERHRAGIMAMYD
jgi:sugar (pentulose or hexulose) kinase